MKQFVADAFTDTVFGGNPAAVCVMDKWIDDTLMQKIAMENNLSETAFAVKEGDKYRLRWFTPGGEIDLCGHATLATAFVIMNFYEKNAVKTEFITLSGILTVERKGELYEMDFPAYELKEEQVSAQITEAIGAQPLRVYMGRDLLRIFDSRETVKNLNPDMDKLKQIPGLLLQATAPGDGYDCVSRSFAPKLNVPEDPVCGSGHCHIVPYWAKRLGKSEILAYQASKRGGVLYCAVKGDRVSLAGKAVLYSRGEIFV